MSSNKKALLMIGLVLGMCIGTAVLVYVVSMGIGSITGGIMEQNKAGVNSFCI